MRNRQPRKLATEHKIAAATVAALTMLVCAFVLAIQAGRADKTEPQQASRSVRPAPVMNAMSRQPARQSKAVATRFAHAYAIYQDGRDTHGAITRMRPIASATLVQALVARPPRPVLTHTSSLRLTSLQQDETPGGDKHIAFEALYERAGGSTFLSTITVSVGRRVRVTNVDGVIGATP